MSIILDHVHVHVANREAAADWYERVLGLERDGRLACWADDRTQPLFIGSTGSRSCIALFERSPEAPPRSGDHTIGLRVTGADFLAFADRLETLNLTGLAGAPLVRTDAVDHGAAWSLHFLDSDGNRIELTSYDHDEVAAGLKTIEGNNDQDSPDG